MTDRPCDIPGTDHDGTARLYPCGWRCTTHAPQARTTTAEPATRPAAAPARRAGPAVETPHIVGALRIDAGEGFEIKEKGPNEFWWKADPRARYECLACRWTSEDVTGAEAVKAFTRHIRTTHQATCTAATSEGAQAA